jgi:hypothetical protein
MIAPLAPTVWRRPARLPGYNLRDDAMLVEKTDDLGKKQNPRTGQERAG